MRSAEQLQAHLGKLRGALTSPMLAAPGKKFYTQELADLAGVPIRAAAAALNSCHNNPGRGLRVNRDMGAQTNQKNYRYWIGEAVTDDRTRVIAWLKKHKRAARISVIARGLKLEFADAATLLAQMHGAHELVRCALPLGGADCFEYRLMGVV